jgi:hypothetical protein
VLLLGSPTLHSITTDPEEPAARRVRCICVDPSCDGTCETEILGR